MLRSMTGFGDAQGLVDGVEFSVEVRSVNGRYFKATLRLPENFTSIEPELDSLVRRKLYRGSVTVSVRMKVLGQGAAYHVNAEALSSYVEQLRPWEVEGNPILRVDLGSLLQLPGVCVPPADDLADRTAEGLIALVAQAVEKLIEMRRKEGDSLRKDLLLQCGRVEENLAAIAERAPQVLVEYRDRLAARVAELTNAGALDIDQDSLAREVAVFAERCDIAEEVSRLRTHVEQFRLTSERDEPVGKKLDFIAQEMLREANTIGSKANDAEITRAVVETKTAIDRIKEQVQNVE